MVNFLNLEGRVAEKQNSPFLSGKSPDNAWGLAMLLSGIYKSEETFREYMKKNFSAGQMQGFIGGVPVEWPMPGEWYGTYKEVFVKARELLTSPKFQVNPQSAGYLQSALQQLDTQERNYQDKHGESYIRGERELTRKDFVYLRGLINNQLASLQVYGEKRDGRTAGRNAPLKKFSFEESQIAQRRRAVLDPYNNGKPFETRTTEILRIISNGAAEFMGRYIISAKEILMALEDYEAQSQTWIEGHPEQLRMNGGKDIQTVRALLGLRGKYQMDHPVQDPGLPFQAYLIRTLKDGTLTRQGGVETGFGTVYLDSLERAGQTDVTRALRSQGLPTNVPNPDYDGGPETGVALASPRKAELPGYESGGSSQAQYQMKTPLGASGSVASSSRTPLGSVAASQPVSPPGSRFLGKARSFFSGLRRGFGLF